MKRLLLFASCLLVILSFPCFADTIVSVTDASSLNAGSLYLGGQYSNVVAVAWTQYHSFSDVAIDALLVSSDASFRSGTAYLMRAIGPGTTSASEIVAPVAFTAPLGNGGAIAPTVLFSGLTLTPGTYYLVLFAPFRNETDGSPLGWVIPTNPVLTSAASARVTGFLDANTTLFPPAQFAPASRFVGTNFLIFNVSGVDTTVPEPSTLVLLGTGGLLGIVGAVRGKLLRNA